MSEIQTKNVAHSRAFYTDHSAYKYYMMTNKKLVKWGEKR
jgi:hypothetical protein